MSSYTGALKGNSVLLAFVDLLILLLSFYMGIRLIKRTSMVTAVAFLFQLSILTAGTMALFSGTFLVPAFEIVIILLGFIIPFAFLVHDYISMKRRIKESGRAAPLIQRLEKENASPRYGEFAENVLDWGGAAGAGIISASLSIKDKTFKKQFMGQIRDANRLIGQGKFEEALTNYKILAGIACSNPAVVYNVAWLLRKRGEYEESVKWYKKAINLLENTNERNEAVQSEEENAENEADERGGKNAQGKGVLFAMAHFGCGMCLYALNKYEMAIVHFTDAMKYVPELREAGINVARAYLALGKADEAEEYIRKALDKKEDYRLRYLLAGICFEKNRDMECKYHLEKAIEGRDDFIEAWEFLGRICRKTGDWAGAENAYKKLAQLIPQDADSYYRLGVALRQEGKTEEAFSSFKTAADINPKHSRALYSMASILDAQGKYDRAEECLKKSLEGDEKLEMAYNLLAEIYISADRIYDAIRVYEEAAAEYPDSYLILYNLGVTRMMAKDYAEAAASFKRAQKITDDDPALYYNWASAAIALKNYSEAARLYKEGLRFKPDDDEMLYGLARISALSGDAEAAIAFLTQCFQINPGLKLRARASHDFASLRTLKAFREITELPQKEEE